MAEGDERLRTVLDAYANFLCEKKLAVPKHQPYLVRWVREFLLFARQHGGYTFEQTLDLFLADVGRRVGVKPWQIQQAADAVRIYRHPYRAGVTGPQGCPHDDDLHARFEPRWARRSQSGRRARTGATAARC